MLRKKQGDHNDPDLQRGKVRTKELQDTVRVTYLRRYKVAPQTFWAIVFLFQSLG